MSNTKSDIVLVSNTNPDLPACHICRKKGMWGHLRIYNEIYSLCHRHMDVMIDYFSRLKTKFEKTSMNLNQFVEMHARYLKEFSESDEANQSPERTYVDWNEEFEVWVDDNKSNDEG